MDIEISYITVITNQLLFLLLQKLKLTSSYKKPIHVHKDFTFEMFDDNFVNQTTNIDTKCSVSLFILSKEYCLI